MKRLVVVVLVGVCILASEAPALQQSASGRWKSYTEMRSVRSVTRSGDTLWAATAGGVFRYTTAANQFSKFSNTDGLSSNDVTTATVDRNGRLWFGTTEGFVNMLDPVSNQWKEVRGIAESNRVLKAVRTLYAHNDTLFIGTDFGVAVYLMAKDEFGDTYANFGFLAQPKVNDILVHKNAIWVATESGVATASLATANLSAPTPWSRYPGGTDFASTNVVSLALFRDTLYAGTGGGASYFQNGFFIELQQFKNKPMVSVRPSGQTVNDKLYVVWNGSPGFTVETIGSTTAPAQVVVSNTTSQAGALAPLPATNNFWIGTTTEGLAQWNGTQWNYHVPNSPRSNLFTSLAVDDAGVLWAASGISGRGYGFYRYNPSLPEGQQWKNYSAEDYPVMGLGPTDPARNDYYKASAGANGSVWISSWGRGVVEIVQDTIRRRIATPTFATAVTNDPAYIVMGGVAVDADGGTWFVNRTAQTGFYLVRLTGDTTFTYFSKTVNSTEGRLTSMVIDRNGTKWMANSEPQDKPATGIAYFNETPGVVAGTASTNGWGVITTPLLQDNNVLSVAVDLDGDVCVGTDAGMVMLTDPSNPTSSQRAVKPQAVSGQVVQAIAVDAINNKWVGTREGILVLSPDGVQLLQYHTVASTGGKLLSNDIRALAIDQQRGILYVGTEKGLSSMEITPVTASRSYTTLEFGPNPYVVPGDDQLVIRNLASNSSIRILSVSGTVVAEFPAQGGGRAFWDGRNSDGEYVPSGIYFVVAYTENGNQLTTGKIAVVRR